MLDRKRKVLDAVLDGKMRDKIMQNVDALPATGGHAEDEMRAKAYQAGEIVCDSLHPCSNCGVYRDGELNNDPACSVCRINPEPDQDQEVDRLVHWLGMSLRAIKGADAARRRRRRGYDDPMFQADVKQPTHDFNNDGEQLVSLLYQPSAEELAGELGVAQTIKEGEQ